MAINDDDDALLNDIIEKSNRFMGRGKTNLPKSSARAAGRKAVDSSKVLDLPFDRAVVGEWRVLAASSNKRASDLSVSSSAKLKFYEFFAGGGMARLGLGDAWRCLFANDFDAKKAEAYRANFGESELIVSDVGAVSARHLPGKADLAWASFPCQDLSLAGAGAGLAGQRSGAFWSFWRLVTELQKESRAPRAIVLENVVGLLTSHKGRDFASICEAVGQHYRLGAVVVDAVHFVPQSRPRLFFVCTRRDLKIPEQLVSSDFRSRIHPAGLIAAYKALPRKLQSDWVWWKLPIDDTAPWQLIDVLEDDPRDVEWHSREETTRLLSMMSAPNRAKVTAAQATGRRTVGGIYRRTRPNEFGTKVQRAEVRFDGVAGCLRTPGGGSSRQTILIVHGDEIQSRLLSPRETARLMGLPEMYKLPTKYNDAYHLTGDGVVVPVVRHLATALLEPILHHARGRVRRAA